MHKSGSKRRVTQSDVAQLAGVSQAMVSYVINNSPLSIPEETRQRIKSAMTSLGYKPNITAQKLRTAKTTTIAGIIPDITNPFYSIFERGIQDIVDKENYDFIIYNTNGEAEKEQKVLNSLLQGRVDGVVGVFFHLTAKDLLPLLERAVAVVRLEAMSKKAGDLPLDNIYIDNIKASKTAVNHLIQKGHSKIGFLASKKGPSGFRIQGYKLALLNNNIQPTEELISSGSNNEDGGYSAMQRLLKLPSPPTAIFATNDLMAMGAIVAIREAGLKVPEEIAVVGFDDIPSAKLLTPALSSVTQQQRQMGQRAAQILFERLNGEVPNQGRSIEMPYKLIIRESS